LSSSTLTTRSSGICNQSAHRYRWTALVIYLRSHRLKDLRWLARSRNFCDNEDNSIFEWSFADAMLFCTWTCMCLQQVQKVCIKGIRLAASGNPLDSIVEGVVILHKGRRRRDMHPRPFWMSLNGIPGSRGWFDLLWTTVLEGVRDKCYVFRAFHPSGPITESRRFLKPPDQYDNVLKVFREVLKRVCNLTPTQGKGYSYHSTRRHEIKCVSMSDLYTQHSDIEWLTIVILKRQMDTLRVLYLDRDRSKLFVYHESIRREAKRRLIYEYRCDARLKTKNEEATRLADTGLVRTCHPKEDGPSWSLLRTEMVKSTRSRFTWYERVLSYGLHRMVHY
jgi:hypothetical protein